MVGNQIRKLVKIINNTIWAWGIERDLNKHWRQNQRLRKKYCAKGWHDVGPCTWMTTNHKGQKLKVLFLRCRCCETTFFTKPQDKKTYLRIKDQRAETIKKSMESILKGIKVKIKGKHRVKEFK